MSARFEELGWRQTPMGVISLRRRFDLSVRADVYEVKLDDEYLMSSLFTVAERELARLALARTPGPGLDVIVGGLGLGYTAQETLDCQTATDSDTDRYRIPEPSSTGTNGPATGFGRPSRRRPRRPGVRGLLRRRHKRGGIRSGAPLPNL